MSQVVVEGPETRLAQIASASGLAVPDQNSIVERYLPFVAQAGELAREAEGVVVTSVDQKDAIKKSRELRLKLRQVRIGVDHTRKDLKENSLRRGQLIDRLAGHVTGLIEPHELRLEEQEKIAQRQEAERKAKLRRDRVGELSHWMESAALAVVGAVEDLAPDQFATLLQTQKDAAAHRAEVARREAEERRKAEEQRQAELELERQERERAQAQRDAAEAEARKEREAREAVERKAREEREAAERQARAERDRERARDMKIAARRETLIRNGIDPARHEMTINGGDADWNQLVADIEERNARDRAREKAEKDAAEAKAKAERDAAAKREADETAKRKAAEAVASDALDVLEEVVRWFNLPTMPGRDSFEAIHDSALDVLARGGRR